MGDRWSRRVPSRLFQTKERRPNHPKVSKLVFYALSTGTVISGRPPKNVISNLLLKLRKQDLFFFLFFFYVLKPVLFTQCSKGNALHNDGVDVRGPIPVANLWIAQRSSNSLADTNVQNRLRF